MNYKVYNILNCSKNECPELFNIRSEVEDFCKEVCEEYNQKCEEINKKTTISNKINLKNFYDSIWGTIDIEERDIFLIDSPIIQRLRRIKQLGMVDYLYSTANHSRFSHTLGVFKVSTEMLNRLFNEFDLKKILIDEEKEKIARYIRVAALFHDTGHMFFSHASEKYFRDYRDSALCMKIENVKSFFRKQISKSPEIAEILSLLLVNSYPTRKLLTLTGVIPAGISDEEQECIIDKICCLIIGFPHSKKWVPFSQIISGPIDSDKLDYLRRDSYETGVPIAVDMSRIFQKIRLVEVTNDDVLVSCKNDSSVLKYEMGISVAAVNTVDQLALSRYMMFENVYYHQKVLTAETYLREAVHKIDKSTKGIFDNFKCILKLTDDKLLNVAYLKSIIQEQGEVIDEELLNEGYRIINNIVNRNLPKRAISFLKGGLLISEDQDIYAKLYEDKDYGAQREFIKSLSEEMEKILELLNLTDKKDFDLSIVSSPPIFSESKGLNSNLKIEGMDKVTERNEIFETDNWMKSRNSKRSQNYIVCNPMYRDILVIALEKLFFEKYNRLLDKGDISHYIEQKNISYLKEQLDKKDYYQNKSKILVKPDVLFRFSSKAKELEKRWSSYNRICDVNDGDFKITQESILRFVHQFYAISQDINEYEIFVEECFKLLDKVEFVSHNIQIKAFRYILDQIKSEKKCEDSDISIFCIGRIQDSSSHMLYNMNDLKPDGISSYKVEDIEKIKPEDIRDNVVFIDDAFYSGVQLTNIFENWKSSEPSQREIHSSPLNIEVLEVLRKKSVYFSFIYTNKENEKKLIESCQEILQINAKIIGYKSFGTNVIDDFSIAKKYFENVGERLIEVKSRHDDNTPKKHWGNTRKENSKLGYNNAQQLIVFPWNTPTYTLTALWLSASTRDFEWKSLFTRQDKK